MARMAQAQVARCCHALIALAQHGDGGKEATHRVDRRIGRAVVDPHDLQLSSTGQSHANTDATAEAMKASALKQGMAMEIGATGAVMRPCCLVRKKSP